MMMWVFFFIIEINRCCRIIVFAALFKFPLIKNDSDLNSFLSSMISCDDCKCYFEILYLALIDNPSYVTFMIRFTENSELLQKKKIEMSLSLKLSSYFVLQVKCDE